MDIVRDDDIVRLRDINTGCLFIEPISRVKTQLHDALNVGFKILYLYYENESKPMTYIVNVEESLKTIKAIEQ